MTRLTRQFLTKRCISLYLFRRNLAGLPTVERNFKGTEQIKDGRNLRNENIVIATSSDELGVTLAMKLAKLKANVAIWDEDPAVLSDTKKLAKSQLGVNLPTFMCNLTNREEIYKTAEKTKRDMGQVTMIINTVSQASENLLLDTPDDVIEKVFKVNVLSSVWLTKAFLPHMIEANNGTIVTISSMAGHMGIPKLSDYCATSAAVINFMTALKTELDNEGAPGIKTTVICPYFLKRTKLHNGTQLRLIHGVSEDKVAERTIEAIINNESVVFIPGWFKLASTFRWVCPNSVSKFFKNVLIKDSNSKSSPQNQVNLDVNNVDWQSKPLGNTSNDLNNVKTSKGRGNGDARKTFSIQRKYRNLVIAQYSIIFTMFKQLLIGVVVNAWKLVILCAFGLYYFSETFVFTVLPILKTRKSLVGKTVLITGGAGGLGQELAVKLAHLKSKVIVWDVDEAAIQKLQTRFETEGLGVHTHVVDVTDRLSVYKHADLIKSEIGPVHILINNAGIVSGHTIMNIPDETIEKTFQVNVISHYWTIKAFLGDMLKKGQGHIVSIGSLTGMLGTYKCTDYSATKYALNGLHESLNVELKAHGHHNVTTTLICPYFINTGMFAGCKPRNMPMLETKDVAKRIIAAISHEESFVTIPSIARFVLPLKNFIPAKLTWIVMSLIVQGPQSMMGLKCNQDTAAA
ncbi:hypothetical protein FQA39_LY10217 [Lamprigera yunnana]|nr:hypothetical protein FQA39_LY10217 [Lamprigera yunnana]